jgi:hypothetical protein
MKRPSSSKVSIDSFESNPMKIQTFIEVRLFAQSIREGVHILTIGCPLEILVDGQPNTKGIAFLL